MIKQGKHDDMYRNVNRRNLTDHGGGPPNPERTPLNPADEASPATPADEGAAAVAADDRMLGGAGSGNGDTPEADDRKHRFEPSGPHGKARLERAYGEQLRRRQRLLDRMTKALRQHGPALGGGWDEVEDLKHVNELLENAADFIETAI